MTHEVSDPFGLRGQLAVVFGAGPGIGGETVAALTGAGCRVIAVDLHTHAADEVTRQRPSLQDLVTVLEADVTSRDSVREVYDTVLSEHGAPSVVVNVIGLGAASPFDAVNDEAWDATQMINVRQQFMVMQESIRVMQRPGAYVAVASINGVVSSPGNVAYGAAKAGLISMVRSVALEFAEDGVRVNAVAPGIIRTPRIAHAIAQAGREAEFADSVPMRRMGEPAEIAKAIQFLASPLASYITGQLLLVDGGASVKYPIALP